MLNFSLARRNVYGQVQFFHQLVYIYYCLDDTNYYADYVKVLHINRKEVAPPAECAC